MSEATRFQIVRSLPGRWAENLTLWEVRRRPLGNVLPRTEPVRFGDHGGRDALCGAERIEGLKCFACLGRGWVFRRCFFTGCDGHNGTCLRCDGSGKER